MAAAYGHGGGHSTIGTACIPLLGLQVLQVISLFHCRINLFACDPTPLCVNRHGSGFCARAPDLLLQASLWATSGGHTSQPLTVQWSAVWRRKHQLQSSEYRTLRCIRNHRRINFLHLVHSKKRLGYWLRLNTMHVRKREYADRISQQAGHLHEDQDQKGTEALGPA